MMERASLSSFLNGRMLSFGKSGDNLGFSAFQSLKIHPFLFLIICMLMGHPDDPVDAPVKDCSKTIKTMIPISKDSTGWPALPSITRSSNFHTKIIQSMLRNYCITHIGE